MVLSAAPLRAAAKSPSFEPKAHVLVVDDQLSFAEMVRDDLEERGFASVAVDSSLQTLELLEHSEFDALVTDIRMPEIDGIELLERARKLAPSRPVIIMTAFGAVDSAIESIRRGAYHYLTKPFKADAKGLVAQAIHAESSRASRRFVVVNWTRDGAPSEFSGSTILAGRARSNDGARLAGQRA